ncbi:AMP-binding protein [Actinokineospora sp. 24-640]
MTRLFHRHLLARVGEHPERPAVVAGQVSLTYGELAELADKHAAALDAAGLRAGDVIVLEFSPRPAAIALMIAAASRGVVFANVSPQVPAARKQEIVGRLGAVAHLGGAAQTPISGTLDGNDLVLTGSVTPRAEPREPAETDLLYVVFTSGSTGRPKGIMMSHRAVVSFWLGYSGFGVAPGVRLGSTSPLQFDFALLDLGMALGAGGTLVQVPSVVVHQPSGFLKVLREQRIAQMNGVPAIWRELTASPLLGELASTGLDTVLYAGEGFPVDGLRALRAAHPALRLVNGFGHSESIACATNVLGERLSDADGRVPFGTRAIDGMRMYLVDDRGRVIDEPDTPGELYIEGDCLFHGYWADPEATAAALVPSPLSGPSVRAFRSGDLAHRDAEGQHYFHARLDDQVKLLGNRIELEEIDLHLRAHPAVADAATALERGEPPRIVAFVRLKPGASTAELRAHCAGLLPRYMVPAVFREVDALPLNANGKVDRAALLGGTP